MKDNNKNTELQFTNVKPTCAECHNDIAQEKARDTIARDFVRRYNISDKIKLKDVYYSLLRVLFNKTTKWTRLEVAIADKLYKSVTPYELDLPDIITGDLYHYRKG